MTEKMQFDCHLPNLLREMVEGHPTPGPLTMSVNLTTPIIAALAERAIVLDDPELNVLCLRLGLYEIDARDRPAAIEAQKARIAQTTPTRDEAVPAGWKLVPVEPTTQMWSAACDVHERMAPEVPSAANFWPAMLAAAPSAPAPASGRVDAVAVKLRRVAEQREAGLLSEEVALLKKAASMLSPPRNTVAWIITHRETGRQEVEFSPPADLPFNRARFSWAPLYRSTVALGIKESAAYAQNWLEDQGQQLNDKAASDAVYACGEALSVAMVSHFNAWSAPTLASLSPAATPVSEAEPGLAKGCCSASSPCFHQKHDPTTICEACRNAGIRAEELTKPAATPVSEAGGEIERLKQQLDMGRCASGRYFTHQECETLHHALATPAPSPAGGDVSRKALDLIEAVESTFDLGRRPALRDRVDGLRIALSAGRVVGDAS